MDFLVFPVPKLLPNFRKLNREIPTNSLENLYKIWVFFGHNFGTRNVRESIKGSKNYYHSPESKQILSH